MHPTTGECSPTPTGGGAAARCPAARSPLQLEHLDLRAPLHAQVKPRPIGARDAPAVRTSRSVAMEAVVGVRDKPSESPWIWKREILYFVFTILHWLCFIF